MPEIKHHFRAGKMNKDLDERLVPNGEYRHALNVQVATSEGDDVGALQNVLGNQQVSNVMPTGAKCIGTIADEENDKIYWFVQRTNQVNAILEYHNGAVNPVLIDTNNVLQFRPSTLITGINIIDGLLFFTDDNSEPKVINIEKFKEGCTNFTTHTQLTDQVGTAYDFLEEDVTVIKKGPTTAPALFMSPTKRFKPFPQNQDSNGNPVPAEVDATASFNVTNSDGLVEMGSQIQITVYGMGWQIGDTVIATAGEDGDVFDDEYGVSFIIQNVIAEDADEQTVVLTVQSATDTQPTTAVSWNLKLKQDDPLFEKDLVRFAYRYKYKDGEYSCFSPFTQVAFLPGTFEYDPAQGYNIGMVNNLRYLKISGFRPSDIPKQVIETELLFKKEESTNIYSVKSFKTTSEGWGNNSYIIESEIIYKLLPSMQLLRPFDNVPLKAKSQELVANRIVYGNYLQQFDLVDSQSSEIDMDFTSFIDPLGFSNATTVEQDSLPPPEKSIKSMRTYQLGVVYRDSYGRETPVQTDQTGSVVINKASASSFNRLNVKVNNEAPSFATSFKFFVKDTSNQYYNLAQDRWYDAEDGNIWLSFPSSERNKVDEETFLILKKKHDDDALVTDSAKYKIIDISNEAPTELKEVKASYGVATHSFAAVHGGANESGFPRPEATYFSFLLSQWKENRGDDGSTSGGSEILSTSNLVVRIVAPGKKSRWYDVGNISLTGAHGTTKDLQINLQGRFENDVLQFYPDGTLNSEVSNIGYEIARIETKNKPEFTGRFFVKVYKDAALIRNILEGNAVEEYAIVNSTPVSIPKKSCGGSGSKGHWDNNGPNETRQLKWHMTGCGPNRIKDDLEGSGMGQSWAVPLTSKDAWNASDEKIAPIRIGRDTVQIGFAAERSLSGIRGNDNGLYRDFLDRITSAGTKIRFADDPNQNVYKIKAHVSRSFRNFFYGSNDPKDSWWTNKRRVFIIKLDRPIQDWDIFTDDPNGINPTSSRRTVWEIVEDYSSEAYRTKNPAIWETEPKEQAELDIYYEASNSIPIAQHNSNHALDYHNCFSFANGVESNRVRDDFNQPFIKKGVKASAPLAEQYKQERRKNGLIYSQIYNSTSGLNGTNQFIMADKITKDLNPEYGSIQKLHVRGTDILAFCEDKVVKILANKDALFNADGNANLTASNRVLGQAIIPPTFGEFGISKNPESFAADGYRCYFTDRARGAVLRLSMNGVIKISDYGMSDYFSDSLKNITSAIGCINVQQGVYSLTLNRKPGYQEVGGETINFKEDVQGWTSFASYIPEQGVSINDEFYTFKNGEIYSHDNETRNNYYGVQYQSSVKLLFNDMPDQVKTFRTLNYEGSQAKWNQDLNDNQYYNNVAKNGWFASSVETDMQSGFVKEFVKKEGKWFNYIHGTRTDLSNIDTSEFSVQGIGQLSGSVTGDTTPTQVTITIVENND